MNGTNLLDQFRKDGSESAFHDLVRRYTNLVYSVARRRLAHDALAQEATQIVFIKLARTAPRLSDDAALAAWLHRATVRVSIDLWRAESRRRAREEHAVAMQTTAPDSTQWNDLAPILDEALDELTETDRRAILIRFFQDKSMRDLGTALGVKEDAAKMRVSPALERLRQRLHARGVALGAAALGAMLVERSVHAAPPRLVAVLAALKYPLPVGLGSSVGLFAFLLHTTKAKIATGTAIALAAGSAALLLSRAPQFVEQPVLNANPQASHRVLAQSQRQADPSTSANLSGASALESATDENPNPIQLLRNVAAARRRVASGSIEFQIAQDRFSAGEMESHHMRLQAVFADSKFRFEQVDRQYSYTLPGAEGGEKIRALIEERDLTKEAAVREGLLKGFEARYVTTYDGQALFRYLEEDGRAIQADILEPTKGSTYAFDPRCLGLRAHLFSTSTIENCLAIEDAKSVQLVGREKVEGIPAWHVRVISRHDQSLEFWVSVANPDHVLSHIDGARTVVSRFKNGAADNPLPDEVIITDYRQGSLSTVRRLHDIRTKFDVDIAPATWSLAGLGMQIGTSVVDNRIHRSIGYWDGTGLSERLPRRPDRPSPDTHNLQEMLAALGTEPTSDFAFESASWIILNTPDGPEVEKAADVILNYHTHRPDLASFCEEQDRVRHRSSSKLLEAILFNNPVTEVRAIACFTLATILKTEADYGRNREATAQAIQRFQQVVDEFAGAGGRGADMARRAAPELAELRKLGIGQPALPLAGMDMAGHPVTLADHGGKVVVLYFWSQYYDEAKLHRELLDQLQGQPFSIVSVNCQRHRTNAVSAVSEYGVTWPTIWDGRHGPIATAWNNRHWPETFVLDRRGIIRFREVRGKTLVDAVEELLKE